MKPQNPSSTIGKERKGRNQTELEIQPDAFPEDAIQAFIDDWIVPMIVEELIQLRLRGSTPGSEKVRTVSQSVREIQAAAVSDIAIRGSAED